MMECSKCGYMMDAFTMECPRCKRFGQLKAANASKYQLDTRTTGNYDFSKKQQEKVDHRYSSLSWICILLPIIGFIIAAAYIANNDTSEKSFGVSLLWLSFICFLFDALLLALLLLLYFTLFD